LKPGKKTVELHGAARPSRIRREPVPASKTLVVRTQWRSREWEIGLAIVGIVLFALALNALSLGIGVITN
jgi:hypothetical protein